MLLILQSLISTPIPAGTVLVSQSEGIALGDAAAGSALATVSQSEGLALASSQAVQTAFLIIDFNAVAIDSSSSGGSQRSAALQENADSGDSSSFLVSTLKAVTEVIFLKDASQSFGVVVTGDVIEPAETRESSQGGLSLFTDFLESLLAGDSQNAWMFQAIAALDIYSRGTKGSSGFEVEANEVALGVETNSIKCTVEYSPIFAIVEATTQDTVIGENTLTDSWGNKLTDSWGSPLTVYYPAVVDSGYLTDSWGNVLTDSQGNPLSGTASPAAIAGVLQDSWGNSLTDSAGNSLTSSWSN